MQRDDYSEALRTALDEEGLLPAAVLQQSITLSKQSGERFDRVLLRRGVLQEVIVLEQLAKCLGIEFYQRPAFDAVDVGRINLLGVDFFKHRNIVPLAVEADGCVPVLMSDPGSLDVQKEISFYLDAPIQPIACTIGNVQRLLQEVADADEDTEKSRLPDGGDAQPDESTELDGGPAARSLDRILAEAVEAGASDVHFEADAEGSGVRVRIHGTLFPISRKIDAPAVTVVARLKVLSGLRTTERRLPQDGRFTQAIAGRKVDFRVSTLPTQYGESVVCRILDPDAVSFGWEWLGFPEDLQKTFVECLERPNGLILITGPTGSGKTTTLYTALKHLNNGKRKIIAVEDPIEYALDGVSQTQVNAEIGMTFARALRSVLRQDPDVIMIGEIRDGETAEIACRAALVGRLVLATLHTNSAKGAATRLKDLGVEDYIIEEVLLGAFGQRLTTRVCEDCGGAGCASCNNLGFVSRELSVEFARG